MVGLAGSIQIRMACDAGAAGNGCQRAFASRMVAVACGAVLIEAGIGQYVPRMVVNFVTRLTLLILNREPLLGLPLPGIASQSKPELAGVALLTIVLKTGMYQSKGPGAQLCRSRRIQTLRTIGKQNPCTVQQTDAKPENGHRRSISIQPRFLTVVFQIDSKRFEFTLLTLRHRYMLRYR